MDSRLKNVVGAIAAGIVIVYLLGIGEFALNWLPILLPLIGTLYVVWLTYNRLDGSFFATNPHQSVANCVADYKKHALLSCSGTELARLIRERKTSSSDLVEIYIDYLSKVNVSINAVVNVRFDQARKEAKDCDKVIAAYSVQFRRLSADKEGTPIKINDVPTDWDRSSPVFACIRDPTSLTLPEARTPPSLASFLEQSLPPFFGVPCTSKECFALAGLPHTSGLVSRAAVLPRYTAPVVLSMQRAGLLIVGCTNTSELCMWIESSNRVYGRTNNPYDLSRGAGGSSGGAGSDVAAGGSALALGSDVGGSIRVPSFFNGVYGHKPTSGYVCNAGQWPPARGTTELYCQPGPICRYPADLWPLLQVMAQRQHGILGLPADADADPTTEAGAAAGAPSVGTVDAVEEVEEVEEEWQCVHASTSPASAVPGTAPLAPRPIAQLARHRAPDDSDPACARTGASPHGLLAYDSDEDEPSQATTSLFTPYPHDSTTFGHADPRRVTETDADAPDCLISDRSALPLLQLPPWRVPVPALRVYSLESFGTASIPCSAVEEGLVAAQRAAVRYLCGLGCEVRVVDVDRLSSDPARAVKVMRADTDCEGAVTETWLASAQVAELAFFSHFRDGFKLWSAGMGASSGPRFRDLLLQPALPPAVRALVDSAAGPPLLTGVPHGSSAVGHVEVLAWPWGVCTAAAVRREPMPASAADRVGWAVRRALVALRLTVVVPLVADVSARVASARTPAPAPAPAPDMTAEVGMVPGPAGALSVAFNEAKIALALLAHVLLLLVPYSFWALFAPVTGAPAPCPVSTVPALLLALIERIPDLSPAGAHAALAQLQTFAADLNQHLLSAPSGAVIVCPPHPRPAPTHTRPCYSPFDFVYTGIFNALRTPATSVPLGLHGGLPAGVQVVGARHADNLTIAVALALHAKTGGWVDPASTGDRDKLD